MSEGQLRRPNHEFFDARQPLPAGCGLPQVFWAKGVALVRVGWFAPEQVALRLGLPCVMAVSHGGEYLAVRAEVAEKWMTDALTHAEPGSATHDHLTKRLATLKSVLLAYQARSN